MTHRVRLELGRGVQAESQVMESIQIATFNAGSTLHSTSDIVSINVFNNQPTGTPSTVINMMRLIVRPIKTMPQWLLFFPITLSPVLSTQVSQAVDLLSGNLHLAVMQIGNIGTNGDTQQASQEASSPQPTDKTGKTEPAEPLTDEERLTIRRAIDGLGASQFAQRELAAAELMKFGKRAIAEMQDALQNSSDAETKLRIEQVVKQLAEGDLQARIKAFIAGQDVNFKGWPVVQRFLGDSSTVRELFVDIMQAHPYVGESMDGTTRDRAIALSSTLAAVEPKINSIREEPNRADLFSLLLVALDPQVPLPIIHEQIVLRLCQRRLVTEIRKDVRLAGPFTALMNSWLGRTSVTNREEVLLVGMEMDLSASLLLADTTLEAEAPADATATACQCISKFGGPRQIPLLMTLIDDSRVVGAPAIVDDPTLTQVRDASIVAIALLLGTPLEGLGITTVELHPARGFLLPSKTFPTNPEVNRNEAKKKIQALLDALANPKPKEN